MSNTCLNCGGLILDRGINYGIDPNSICRCDYQIPKETKAVIEAEKTTKPLDPKTNDELDRLIIENQSEDGSIDISDQSCMRDEILSWHNRQTLTLLEELKKNMPERRQLVEPVTGRIVTENGEKVGIDLEADIKGSLKFVQDNGFNIAIDSAQQIIDAKIEEVQGSDLSALGTFIVFTENGKSIAQGERLTNLREIIDNEQH